MTSYVAIADSEIDPESPGTTTLFTKLRDNPIAITEGASGAPTIQSAAIATNAVTTAKIADANVTPAKLSASSAGSTTVLKFLGSGDNTFTSTDSTYPTGTLRSGLMAGNKFSATCIKSGTITVYYNIADSSGNDSHLRIYKNGSNIYDHQEPSNYPTYTTQTTNISLSIGDEIVIVIYNASGVTTYVKNLQIRTSGADYCVV